MLQSRTLLNLIRMRCHGTVPEAARKAVGTAIVCEIERIARRHALQELELLASVNAQPFYETVGYQAEAHTEHVFSTGVRMAAVKMRKALV
jgi:hypothetical protein